MADLDAAATPDMAVAAQIVQAHHAALQSPSPMLMAKCGGVAVDFAGVSLFDQAPSAFEAGPGESVFDPPPVAVAVDDSMMMVDTSNAEPTEPDEPPQPVPDHVVQIDGITVEEFSAPPPPLPRRSASSSSPQLPSLHGVDLPATKSRPPLVQCDRCRKWRLIEAPIPSLPPQWTCPNDGCDEDEDHWASKAQRIVPYRRVSLPNADQERQQAEERKKIQEMLPRLPTQLRSYSFPESLDDPQPGVQVDNVFWTVPKPFVETDERKQWYRNLQNKLLAKGQLTRSFPKIGPLKQPVDLYALFHAVQELSTHASSMNDIWVQAAAQLDLEVTPTALRACYMRFLQLLTPIRSIAMRSDGASTPAKRVRQSLLAASSPGATNAAAANTDFGQLYEMMTSLTERVASLEQVVARLVDSQQATSLEALQSINSRVVELSENVHQSNVIMQELLPEFKEPLRDP